MAEASTLHDAFIAELRDTFGAERQLQRCFTDTTRALC
jgi:ferritin-like metal-binding protein YciE